MFFQLISQKKTLFVFTKLPESFIVSQLLPSGLYGGLDQKAIHQRKGLKKSQKILDHMGSTELAANLFRATQTEEKLKRDGVNSKQQANTTHFDVGRKVRQTIQELGGTMPEELPTPQVSIKQLENSVKITEKK